MESFMSILRQNQIIFGRVQLSMNFYTFFGLVDGGIGHTDDRKSRESFGGGKLDFDGFGVDPFECGAQQLFHGEYRYGI